MTLEVEQTTEPGLLRIVIDGEHFGTLALLSDRTLVLAVETTEPHHVRVQPDKPLMVRVVPGHLLD